MTDSFGDRLSSLPIPQILGAVAAAVLLAAGGSFLLSERQFKAATEEHAWLRHAAEQRTFADRFRFAFTDTQGVATALAPAAVAGVEALPLEFTALEDARGLVASLNDINPACALIAVAPAACGEAAVAGRQARLEQRLEGLPLKEDYWIERNGLQLAFSKLILMSARVCGLTPYRTETALLIKPVDGYGQSGVTGWKSLSAGECTEVSFGKYRRPPKLFAHSRAADEETLESLREDAVYRATWGYGNATWGASGAEATNACVAAEDDGVVSEACGSQDSAVGFRAVHTAVSDGVGKGVWLLADPGLCRPDCAWNQPSNEAVLGSLQKHAAELNGLISLRKEHRQRYGTSRPYVNGVETVDDNGPYRAGVRVVAAQSHTPFGVESPFRVGDVITELAGVPVFSPEDLDLALARFVATVGANKTYLYQFWRYDPAQAQAVKYENSATVYFNASYWLANGYSNREVSAYWHGFWNAFSFGWYRDFGCAFQRLMNWVPSFTDCKIAAANEWMLIRQLYPDEYSWGSVPAMLLSPIRMLLGVTGVSLSLAGELVVEVVEAGLSAAADSAPGQAIEVTAQQFTESIVVGRLTDFGTALIRPGAFS
jgi:hypothetical protein